MAGERYLLLAALLALAACKPGSDDLTARGSICANTKQLTSGQLCAIQPSKVDSRTKDAGTTSQGFGYHVVATPSPVVKGLWIHFTGSYGKPFYKPASYLNEVWLGELLGQGYMVVQIAYDNAKSVASDCSQGDPGGARDNCAGEILEELITGTDKSPYRQTDEWNGVDYRLKSLLSYLKTNGVVLPTGIDPAAMNWNVVRVSGHSQGAEVAYWIVKNRGVKFGCFLAGPFSPPDSVNLGPDKIADWFTVGPHLTPTSQMGAFLTVQDTFYRFFVSAYDVIGLGEGREWFEVDLPPYTDGRGTVIDGHSAAVNDPLLKPQRAQACFRG